MSYVLRSISRQWRVYEEFASGSKVHAQQDSGDKLKASIRNRVV
jgi:hypothetical protein